MTTRRTLTALPGFSAPQPAPLMRFYTAVIPFGHRRLATVVCMHTSVESVVEHFAAEGAVAAFVVPTRRCTKASMIAEAARIERELPEVPSHVIAINPSRERVVASPIAFGTAAVIAIAPRHEPTPPTNAGIFVAPTRALDAAPLDVGADVRTSIAA